MHSGRCLTIGLDFPGRFFCFEELEKDVSSNHGIDFG